MEEQNFHFEVLAWAADKPNGFNYNELMKIRKFTPTEIGILQRYLENASLNYNRTKERPDYSFIPETIFHQVQGGTSYEDQNSKFILTSDALFKYLDYQELKFARANASQARQYSIIAIGISIFAIIASALVPFLISKYMTQTVRIEKTMDSGASPE